MDTQNTRIPKADSHPFRQKGMREQYQGIDQIEIIINSCDFDDASTGA